MKRILVAAGASALLLAACSSGGSTAPSSSAAATSAAPSSASASASASASSEELFASLCDEATAEQKAAIEGAMKPDYTVSQLVDVRTDDAGAHALLGFVQGPGLAVLAIWTGDGVSLDGLSAADEFSAQASTAPQKTPDAETQKLVDATVQCYTTLFAPQQDSGKKDKKKS